MNVTIRKADLNDFPAILSLIKEFAVFQKSDDKVTITLEQMSEDENLFQCFVAEKSDHVVVGFASFFLAYYSWTGKALYLDDLYVREEYRNQSIGRKLLDRIVDFATEQKCKKVRWQVSKWNAKAMGFLQQERCFN